MQEDRDDHHQVRNGEDAQAQLPAYHGGKFSPGEYDIPEEELIGWSEAALRVPLNNVGFRRYMELFRQVLPEESRKLSLEGSTDE